MSLSYADIARWGVGAFIYYVVIPAGIALVLGVGYLVRIRLRKPAGR